MSEVKLVVLGAGGVGKSAVTIQFVQNIFVQKYDPTIGDSYRKNIVVNDQNYYLEIFDTAGMEAFTAMRDLYIRNGQGFLMVYSITSQSTFIEVIDYFEQVLHIKEEKAIPMLLLGNKSDMDDQREVTQKQGENLASKFGASFIETSAKYNINIEEAFMRLVKRVIPTLSNKDNHKKARVRGRKGCELL